MDINQTSVSKSNLYNVIIIGGGCAGLTASTWCGRAGLTHLVFSGTKCDASSMLSTTSIVENFPGITSIDGKEIIKKLKKQALLYGGKILEKCIVNVDFTVKPFKVWDREGIEYQASSIILATGSIPNRLNLENEDKLWGKYISTCVCCDAPAFKNKRVVVLGGGDSSLEEAIGLTRFTNKVTLIHRKNTFRASVALQKKVQKNSKINVVKNMTVQSINMKDNKLVSITCINNESKQAIEIKTDALFYALGFCPNTNLVKDKLELDEGGYIVKKSSKHFENVTSIDGVFCAGDCSTQNYRQAVLAVADGVKASLDVNKYLHEMHIVEDEFF